MHILDENLEAISSVDIKKIIKDEIHKFPVGKKKTIFPKTYSKNDWKTSMGNYLLNPRRFIFGLKDL